MNTSSNFPHKIIFKVITGSHAYGTNTPESDIDIKGVYVQPDEDILGLNYVPQYEVSKDESYYEIRRFIDLLMETKPNVLEILYTPQSCILVEDESFTILKNHAQSFLTKHCKDSFGGYAVGQIKKAKGTDKKINWEKTRVERKGILDFCYIYEDGKSLALKEWLNRENKVQEMCGLVKIDHFRDGYGLYYDFTVTSLFNKGLGYHGIANENSNEVRLSSIPKGPKAIAFMTFNKDAYSIHCKDYREYQTWLQERNEARLVDVMSHDQKIDGKNMLHCRRLLDVALEIPKLKRINVWREDHADLLKIRRGEVNLQSLIEHATTRIGELEEVYQNSDLPDSIDRDLCNILLLQIRKAAWKQKG